MGFIAAIAHPFRWLKFFVLAMLYGPNWSPYDAMAEAYNRKRGIESGSGGMRGMRGLSSGSGVRPRLVDSDGYSDKEDESYYGM